MELKDYLHLYTGCEIMINPHDSGKRRAVFIGFTGVDRLSALVKYRSGPDGRINLLFIKPLLRPLSCITEEETDTLKQMDIRPNEEVFNKIKATAQMNNWLRKNHFDIDGLIEAGLAIDSTKTE